MVMRSLRLLQTLRLATSSGLLQPPMMAGSLRQISFGGSSKSGDQSKDNNKSQVKGQANVKKDDSSSFFEGHQSSRKSQRSSSSSGRRAQSPRGKSGTGSGRNLGQQSKSKVKYEPEKQRFTMDLGDGKSARIDFKKVADNVLELYHTELPQGFKGHEIGESLAKGVLETIQKNNMKVRVTCCYLKDFLAKSNKSASLKDLIVDGVESLVDGYLKKSAAADKGSSKRSTNKTRSPSNDKDNKGKRKW